MGVFGDNPSVVGMEMVRWRILSFRCAKRVNGIRCLGGGRNKAVVNQFV